MVIEYLDFEKPIEEIEKKISEIEISTNGTDPSGRTELRKLKKRSLRLRRNIFTKLSPWQRTQVARHPQRPYPLDYIQRMLTDFVELHGDRKFADDRAIVAGFGKFEGLPVAVVAHQKGRNIKENIIRNFGMPHPEGYRKALRIMKLAEKFHRPIISLIDTAGAYPGIGAEERGVAEAIAYNIYKMALLRVPIICVVTGEGGSGGAIAIGMGDRVLMLENAIYSVISPEGCAAILFRNKDKASKAAESLKLTAADLFQFGIIDEIVKEPTGGSHRDYNRSASILRRVLRRHLNSLQHVPLEELMEKRYNKYRNMGVFKE